ncbi:thiosulfate oxidation carrier protein SoxY [Pseudovibrio sp. Tun.PSC04-5.I4]|uniref:thiosulfate oxidation carrier protein SoxY n=1 Tax=Pseudovibrio sp. Tun.PSC04-5.I4 TaxID=1798213 RepID=UPI000887A758|nr:thiosulfate oxidation carrier protein SoxY [Pseudovibrio sp. Tun.PSC04-5.I4]SDQ75934.1 sulfur-oxidizing protein SoxY [Pseudovibrio sp. Tun.PSC04-5.I4]
MAVTRREALGLAVGSVAALSMLRFATPAFATGDAVDAAIMDFTGGAKPVAGDISIGAPEIAENGNTVPVQVSAPGAASILLLAAGNPSPGVATFHFSPLSGAQEAKTRIRLAKTQDIIAVAKMPDGSAVMSKRSVKVTIGGCGG